MVDMEQGTACALHDYGVMKVVEDGWLRADGAVSGLHFIRVYSC